MIELLIDGELPSLNEYIAACRTKAVVGARFKAKDEERLIPLFMAQTKTRGFNNPVKIEYTYYCKNCKKDLDNIAGYAHKVIQDSLVKAGILRNDGWEDIIGFSDNFWVDRENPRIEVKIWEVGKRHG